MKGFVLAAGFGTRLKPITEILPKPLLPIGNLPLVAYALKLLAHYNIRDIAINTHYLAPKIKTTLGDGSRFGVRLTYSHEDEILGTGGALRQMQRFLNDDTFVVLNSDTLIDLDLTAAIAAHRQSRALATLVVRPAPKEKSYGLIETNERGEVLRLVDKGIEGRAAHAFMFTGVQIIEPRLLEYIPPYVNSCIIREAYPKALKNGEKLNTYVYNGFWADAGEPELYFQLNQQVLSRELSFQYCNPWDGIFGHSHLAKNAEIIQPVFIADDVIIENNAQIGPYCLLGRNVHIGQDSQLSHTILLENTKVPNETHWHRCIALEDKLLHF